MEKVQLQIADLGVEQELEWDIFDSEGRLLIKKGMMLHSAKQIEKIINMPAFRYDDSPSTIEEPTNDILDVLSPFDRITEVNFNVESFLTQIISVKDDQKINLADDLMNLCDEIIALCEYDLDALLGAIHLNEQYRYTVSHPLHTSVFCYMVAQKLEMDIDKTVCLVGAALTANVGMMELQESLNLQTEPLTGEQREAIFDHPKQSALMLKRVGVRNKLWLEIVLQHHEQISGKGYPRRLQAEQFIREARILALADRYHAMVSPRAYRDCLLPTQALKRLFKDCGKEIDETLGLMFIKEIGIYPPGSFVRLKNGETAIVTRRGKDNMKPTVKSVLNSNGAILYEARTRDCNEKRFEITGLCPPLKDQQYDLMRLWDYVV